MICNDNQAEHNIEGGITLDKMQARTISKGFLKNIQEQIHIKLPMWEYLSNGWNQKYNKRGTVLNNCRNRFSRKKATA